MSDFSSEPDTDMSDSSSEESDYDAFNQFVNGDPYRIINWIRDGKVDKDAQDDDHGESLLIWACRHRRDALIKFLVEQDCDVNLIAHSDGQTALDLCENFPSFVQLLREHGAKTSDEIWAEQDESSEDTDTTVTNRSEAVPEN